MRRRPGWAAIFISALFALPSHAQIGIQFVGQGAPMARSEIAGVVAQSNWNPAWGTNGSESLVDATGAKSGTVTWSTNGDWKETYNDAPGNARLMRGYLDTVGGATTATVSGLPAGDYTVYVYAEGDNGGGNRTGAYQLGGTTTSLLDAAGTSFNGAFVQGGNYLAFTITGTGFTLTATPGTTTDIPRAPLNAIQIVPVAGVVQAPPPPPPPPPPPALTGKSLGNIMPLGDSITYGCCNYNVNPVYAPYGYEGYYGPLATLLTNAGYSFAYVGSVTSNGATPYQMEGHPGYTCGNLVAGVDAWIAAAKPNLVLLMCGTNDMNDGIEAAAPAVLDSLVRQIAADAPGVRIIVATIPPITSPALNALAWVFNQTIPGLVASEQASGISVSMVDVFGALGNAQPYQLFDGIHPTDDAYDARMAPAWFAAITNSN